MSREVTELPSTKFRATFQRLAEPTVVTVNGHPIGTWTPGAPRRAPDADIERGPLRGSAYEREMEDEVARLKRELAKRPLIAEGSLGALAAAQEAAKDRFLREPAARRQRQRVIDETLRKIGTKKR